MASTKKTPQSSVLSYQRCIFFGIIAAMLHLLLIAVAFCMSQDIYYLASWLQILAESPSLKHTHLATISVPYSSSPSQTL